MFLPAPHRLWALLTTCLLVAAPAVAQEPTSGTFVLDTELYRGVEADFGEVAVEEDGAGGLHVTVTLDPAVAGARASVQRIFLSMDELPDGLEAVPDDPDALKTRVHPQRHAWYTMGADLGAIVSVRPRHDKRRHHWFWRRWHSQPEPVQTMGFTLRADAPLTLADVQGMKATWRDVVTQIGVMAYGVDLGWRHPVPGLLGGLFEADPPPSGSPGGGPPPEDGTIPPGCLGEVDPVTGEVLWVICP